MPSSTLFRITCDSLPDSAHVVAFQGHEGISAPYRFEIGVMVPNNETINTDAVISSRATLTLTSEQGPQHFHGVLRRVDMVHAWEAQSLYRLTLEPELMDLALTRHSMVMVNVDALSIWRTLTHARGALPDGYTRLALSATYAERLHVCQYKESNLQFLHRQLEREGAYYYFAHSADPLQPEQLVITDHKEHHQPSRPEPVRYVPLTLGAAMSGDAMDGWVMNAGAQPRDVTTVDFDYLNPALNVTGGPVDVSSDGGGGHHYHGDDVRTPEEAKHQSTIRAQAMRAARVRFNGNGSVYQLRAGFTFELVEHPHDAMNQRYLAVEVQHYGNDGADSETLARLSINAPAGTGQESSASYQCAVTAIAADTQYRHPRATPTPRIDAVERGFIDGPDDSEYAQIDEHGRYKVAIHFDERWRSAPDGEGNCSTWVRMLQPHGGPSDEGFHFPLRKGTEVMISFVGGDPDRPIIMGVAPNALQPSPVAEKNHTQNVIQTGGLNRIEIEDKKGKEYIDISTPPKDTYLHLGEPHDGHGGYIIEHTNGNQVVTIGGDQDSTVGGDRIMDVSGVQKAHIVGNVSEDYDADHNTVVKANRSLNIGGDEGIHVAGERSDFVDSTVEENYGSDVNTVITGAHSHSVLSTQTNLVAGSQTITTGTRKDTVLGPLTQNVAGAVTQHVAGPFKINCSAMDITTTSGIAQTAAGDWFKKTSGVTVALHIGAKVGVQVVNKTDVTIGTALSAVLGVEVKGRAGGIVEAIGAKKASFVAGPKVEQAVVTYERSPLWLRAGTATGIVGTTLFRGQVSIL